MAGWHRAPGIPQGCVGQTWSGPDKVPQDAHRAPNLPPCPQYAPTNHTKTQKTNDENVIDVDAIVAKLDKVLYTNKEMMKMLDCNDKTLRKYRNDGYLSYVRVCDKIYYTVDDICQFIKNNHIVAYQYC